MTAYASIAEAKQTIGGHVRTVCEISLLDPAGNRPSGTFWTTPRVLHLCGGEPFLRDSTSTTGFIYYESLVKEWGAISQSCEVGQAFGNIANVQLVLHNKKINAQVDNSVYTFSSGTPGFSPVPTGDQVQLAELVNFYNFIGSTVTVKILFFPESSTDQSSANYNSDTVYTGIIESFNLDNPEEIVLEIIQDQTTIDTILPGRLLETSPIKDLQTQRAPIVYGDYHSYDNTNYDYTNGLSLDAAILGRLFNPTLVPAFPYLVDNNGTYNAGEDNTKTQTHYIYNDTRGRTSGWDYQDGFPSGKGDGEDRAFAYHPEADVFGVIIEGTYGASTSGQTIWPNTASPSYEQTIINHGTLRGEAYVPCNRVKSSTSATNITNPEYMFDGDPFTGATMPVDSANFVELSIKNVPPLGNSVILAGCIRAYVIIDTTTATNGTKLKFGIYRTEPSWEGYWGTGPIESHASVGDTAGYITAASSQFTKGIYDQDTQAAVSIPRWAYIRDSGYVEPFTQWDWKCSVGGGDLSELVIRIEPSVLGGAGETVKIIGAGIIVRYVPNQSQGMVKNVGIATWPGGVTVIDPSSQRRIIKQDIQNVPITLWMMPQITMRDRDVNLGSCGTYGITAVCNTNITWPTWIPVHLMLKFGEGLTYVDTADPVNYSGAATTAGANFGSSVYAAAMIDDFAYDVNAFAAQLPIVRESTLRQVLQDYLRQWPLMVYKDVMGGKYLMACYPGGSPLSSNRYYFGNDIAEFHPNIDHPSSEHLNKPYVVSHVRVRPSGSDEIYNRFRIRYRYFAPTDSFVHQMVYTESPNDCIVYNHTTERNNGTPSDFAAVEGYDPSAVCATSQSRYAVKRWLPTIDCPSIHAHGTAVGFMEYLLRRFSQPRLVLEATLGTEGYDLKPGHIVRFSKDMNLVYPYMDYAQQGAKKKGWDWDADASSSPHSDYLVLSVSKQPTDTGILTTFSCEQIMYGVTGTFWTPSNDASCLSCLRADDITGLSDGAEVATWQKLVGQDATQSTAANRPLYRAASGTLAINARPCVDFDGTNDRMVIGGAATIDSGAATNVMHVIVMNSDTSATGDRPIFGWRHDVSNRHYGYQNHSTPNNIAVQNGGTLRDSSADGSTGWQVLVIVCDSTNGLKVYRNGTQIGSTTTYAQNRIANTVSAEIGSDTAGANFFDGRMWLYSVTTDVTDATRYKYEGMAAHAVGIETSLPVNHTYRFAPPVNG